MAKKIDETTTDESTDETPSYMTAEAFNAAMTARDRRLEKKINDLLTPVLTAVSDLQTKTKEATSEKPADGASDELTKRLKAMEDALNAERKARADREAEMEKMRLAAELADQRSKVATALRDAGVAPTLAKAALAYLETEGKIVRDESGAVRMRQVDKFGVETMLELSEGLGAWMKDEGAAFMPARPVAGSGNQPQSRPGKGAQLSPKEQAKQEARELLRSALSGQTTIE